MMTFRKGTSGAPVAARAMADYLAQPTMTPEMAERAAYYLRSGARADLASTAALPGEAMPGEVAEMLGLDPKRAATPEEVSYLLQGLRADGSTLPGTQRAADYGNRQRVTYYDFTLSAPKSVSVAMALAPTEAERFVIVRAHQEASAVAMDYLEERIGRVRRGAGGSHGSEPGRFGYLSFLHLSARPTVHIPHTEADGTPSTLVASVTNPEVPGDMHLHTHHIVPNAVRLADGTVGTLDTLAMHDAVHETGGVYQAFLATRLRAQGVPYDMDPRTELGRIPTVPEEFCAAMAKRTRNGEDAAREYAKVRGLNWDEMDAGARVGLLKGSIQGRGHRRAKSGEAWAEASWGDQAKAYGYQHRSVVDPNLKHADPPPPEARLLQAYQAALPVLGRQFDHRSVLSASAARVAATRGLIVAGVEGVADINAVTRLMREHGVSHAGRTVPLIWAETQAVEGAVLSERRPSVKITTGLHVEWERRAMALMTRATEDRTGTLASDQVERAVALVAERDGLSFEGEHGAEQRRIIDAIATGGRFVAVIGGAGVGKTTLLRVPVAAWQAQGWEVFGTALAWRQASPLADVGIPESNAMAVAALLHRVKQGQVTLNARSVLFVDEMSQIGTHQQLELLELRERHGFTMVQVGDDRQGGAIEAGNSYALIRQALGHTAVSEIESTVRQLRQRDQETTLMFREGRAAEGIARLREDGHAMLVPGGRDHAIQAAADLWAQRTTANAEREGFSLSISAPTNQDARDIGAAIRAIRQARGDMGRDAVRLDAEDQSGATFNLPLAEGDRVRLFAVTRARLANGRSAIFGSNGAVIQVGRIEGTGFHATNAKGTNGFVRWDDLRDRESGRIRLTYGDALSIDAIQSVTSTEHLNVVPDGSAAVEAKRAYVAGSRSREATYLFVSDGRERQDEEERRAMGDPRPVTETDVWAHVAANFSRQQDKELATELLRRAQSFRTGTVRGLASAFQGWQQREAEGKPPFTAAETRQQRQDGHHVAAGLLPLSEAVARRGDAVQQATRRLAGPRQEEAKATREARRAVRPAAARPKQEAAPMRQPITQTEAQAEFADALHRAGLRPPGAPIMDGKRHRVPVEGDRKGQRSGSYVGHLDGYPAGHIQNFKQGRSETWSASRPAREMTPEERTAERARIDADWAAREAERARREASVSRTAEALWRKARPATEHPYLARKGVQGHGLREDRRGNLLVPMRDAAGRLWGVQTIAPDGTKLFIRGGRKTGTHAVLGTPQPGEALVIAEGFATAATVRELTGLPVVVAFDSGNLAPVAEAIRARDPERTIVFAADNDHHLPRRPVPLPNSGREKAEAAAAAVRGSVLMPAFPESDRGTDWNDYAVQHGLPATRAKIEAFLTESGVTMPDVTKMPEMQNQTPMQPTTTQAQRDAARQRSPGVQKQQASHAAAPAAQAASQAAQQANQRQQQQGRGPGQAPGL